MTLSLEEKETLVVEANLAPSVHNTQPTRWTQDGNALVLSLDKTRLLSIADPCGHDARLSMGAALHGTRIAANRLGLGVRGVESDEHGARIEFGGIPVSTWDKDLIERRITWRHGFANQPKADLSVLTSRIDTTLTADPSLIDTIAQLNDTTSLAIMRNRAFRDELRAWMRLSRTHPDWARDGLSAAALGLSGFEAAGAGFVLRSPVFEVLDGIGLGRTITVEAAKTRTAHWIAAFHRPQNEDPLLSGEAFYDLWLTLTTHGQAAWPMAALADEPEANAEICRLMGVPAEHRLINVLRIGPLPKQPNHKRSLPKARLSPAELIIN